MRPRNVPARVYLRLLVLQILLSIGLLWVLAAVIVERTL
jgi:hypothetical protein